MTDENTRALIAEAREFIDGKAQSYGYTLIRRLADALSALTVPDVDVRERLIDVLVMSPLSDYAGTDMGPITRTADEILAAIPVLPRAVAPEPDASAVLAQVRRYLERFNPGGTHAQDVMAQALEHILEGEQVAWAPSDDAPVGGDDAED